MRAAVTAVLGRRLSLIINMSINKTYHASFSTIFPVYLSRDFYVEFLSCEKFRSRCELLRGRTCFFLFFSFVFSNSPGEKDVTLFFIVSIEWRAHEIFSHERNRSKLLGAVIC